MFRGQVAVSKNGKTQAGGLAQAALVATAALMRGPVAADGQSCATITTAEDGSIVARCRENFRGTRFASHNGMRVAAAQVKPEQVSATLWTAAGAQEVADAFATTHTLSAAGLPVKNASIVQFVQNAAPTLQAIASSQTCEVIETVDIAATALNRPEYKAPSAEDLLRLMGDAPALSVCADTHENLVAVGNGVRGQPTTAAARDYDVDPNAWFSVDTLARSRPVTRRA